MTDLKAAKLCYASYWDTSSFDASFTEDGTTVYLKLVNDSECAIVFPGSESASDWERDLMSVAMTDDPAIGPVGIGFVEGVRSALAMASFEVYTNRPLVLCGHSLGGARALLAAAILVKEGIDPERLGVYTFGSPCPGGSQLADILKSVSIRSFRNNDDEVCGVLTRDPGFVHPRPLIQVHCQRILVDPWLIFADHHMQHYVAAIALMP